VEECLLLISDSLLGLGWELRKQRYFLVGSFDLALLKDESLLLVSDSLPDQGMEHFPVEEADENQKLMLLE
jgi:hypothetical protein